MLGDNRLEVEQACSGLRIFVGILALAFAYVIVVRRAWWEKALLLASAIPIALLANASRIVATGLLYQYVSGEAAQRVHPRRGGLGDDSVCRGAVCAGVVVFVPAGARGGVGRGRRRRAPGTGLIQVTGSVCGVVNHV